MIQIQNMWFSYQNDKNILKNISFRIKDGESVGILGKNGAGKTTLIKTFNGLLKPNKGEVLIDKVSTFSESISRLSKKVGIAFQNPDHILFSGTVRDEILFSLKNWNLSTQDIDEKFEKTVKLFQLEPLLDKSPFILSGGQRKLVSIASIFSWEPKHIILDEPTIGQDSNHKKLLTRILKNYVNDGNVLIIITHDVDWAIKIFSRIIILKDGQILADGSPERIFYHSNIIEKSELLPPQIVSLNIEIAKIWNDFPKYIINEDEMKKLMIDYSK
ncbi:MAG: ATP-binding cassette domain-containing protein [Candidatus Lokiarchaeota archaeon]|nr:ATP-binding cassette domain-containing protein [Candidatus Lokiarchaeota archaeon]